MADDDPGHAGNRDARDVERPVYGEAMSAQIKGAIERLGPGSVDKLLHAGDTWTIS